MGLQNEISGAARRAMGKHRGYVLALAVLGTPVFAADQPDVAEAQAVGVEVDALRQRIDELERRLDAAAASERARSATDTHDSALEWSGYVVALYETYDFYRNIQDDSAEPRARTDLERVILELEAELGSGFSAEIEVEFEHGGTGTAVEFEPEEFGEFETETEHGGEVVIEQAWLQWQRDERLGLRFGHLLVPVGMVNSHHKPGDYYTVRRSPAEVALIPSVWHETGVQAFGAWAGWSYSLQLVSGLDSSTFNSSGWVSDGSTRRLEQTAADSLASVLRVDYLGVDGLLLGGSFYYGDSAANRPLPNLAEDAYVSIGELHLRFDRGPLVLRAEYLHGDLQNADLVSSANLQSYNPGETGVATTPVASAADAWYVEAGVNVLAWRRAAHGRLDLFARYDDWDSMAEVDATVTDNPRFDRNMTTVGLNYFPIPRVVFKGEYAHYRNGDVIANDADLFSLGLGFEF